MKDDVDDLVVKSQGRLVQAVRRKRERERVIGFCLVFFFNMVTAQGIKGRN